MAGGSCVSSSSFIILLMFVTASLIYSTDDVHAHNLESTKGMVITDVLPLKRCEWILKTKNLSQASQISIPMARSGRGKRYILSRIPYSANCCCWYQLEWQLITSGDVDLNPGPNTNISGSEQSRRVVNHPIMNSSNKSLKIGEWNVNNLRVIPCQFIQGVEPYLVNSF